MTEQEPVGTVAEEAAKLFAAFSAWGHDHASEPSDGEAPDGSAECRWCPICQTVRLARGTSPEVREHLTQAALSLALAVKSLLEEPDAARREAAPVEKIDLTEE